MAVIDVPCPGCSGFQVVKNGHSKAVNNAICAFQEIVRLKPSSWIIQITAADLKWGSRLLI